MNSSILESFNSSANAVIEPCTIQGIRGSKNLKCLSLKKASFNNYKLSDLPIDKSPEIQFLDLSGTNGLKVLPNAQNVIGIYQAPVPFSWSALTKLGVINLRDAGLSAAYVDNFLVGLSQVATVGLGSAAMTKVIYLDGINGTPTAASTVALAKLATLGFTIHHSDPTKAAELEPNPCCGGDCVDCGGGPVTPIVPQLVTVTFPDNIDNGQTLVQTGVATGVVLGGNYTVIPVTDLAPLYAGGLIVSFDIVTNGLLTVTVKNLGDDDDVVIPTLSFNIYSL